MVPVRVDSMAVYVIPGAGGLQVRKRVINTSDIKTDDNRP